jgi:hypothetical protein
MIFGFFSFKIIQNWMLTGSFFLVHPDYTGPGIFSLLFDAYDTTLDPEEESTETEEEDDPYIEVL